MFKTKIPSPAILTIALAALVGCQSATESDSGANANLTLVTLSVPNMT